MRLKILVLLLLAILTLTQKCQRNRYEYLSAYTLGRQQDLTEAFKVLAKNISIAEVSYKDEVFRTYRIYNFKPALLFAESKQKVEISQLGVVKVYGGTLRLTYTFEWEKKQLSESVKGNASGSVTSDPMTFEKILQTTPNYELRWSLFKLLPLTISNSLTISKITPYKAQDSEIINQMLNSLPTNATTAKIRLIEALNQDLESILRTIIDNDPTWKIDRVIDYSYTDYRGQFAVSYDNVLKGVSLKPDGLNFPMSQSIQNYEEFECGDPVPYQPLDVKIFGGHQQFLSNSLIKSTLKYALQRGFLDIVPTNDNWQSRAFQFFMGDVHDVIPITKNISTFLEISGRCKGLNDSNFEFKRKTDDSYYMVSNFTCNLNFSNNKLLGMNILVNYTIKPILYSRNLDFVVTEIEGVPEFLQEQKYKLVNKQLALFMITETLNTVKSGKVLGSGYRISARKYPNIWVRDNYIVLYDSSLKPKQIS